MPVKIIKQGELNWINISKMDAEALDYLKSNYKFHHLDYEDVAGEVQTPKLDVYKNYLFLVFHFPHWHPKKKEVKSYEVDIFLGANFLITIQHGKNKELKNFFYRCMKNRKTKAEWMKNGSGFLLYKITESLFRSTQPIIDNMGKKISFLEKEIFAGEQDTKTVKELAIHRRNILSLRRTLDPQRYLIANLSHIKKEFMDENLTLYFDNVNDYLSKIWSITENFKDTIDGLHVTVESLINHRTNKVISALTVISVSLLPLTLLSGIYGMNIAGLPYAQNPLWVWIMFLGLLSFILIVIAVMKKKKWL